MLVQRVGNNSRLCDNIMIEMSRDLFHMKTLIECIGKASHASGQMHDAVRTVQQWASGESSCLPSKAI